MFARFGTGLRLARASWGVLRADKSLAIFPIVSSVTALLAIALVLAPWWLGFDASEPVSAPSTAPPAQVVAPADPAAQAMPPGGTSVPAPEAAGARADEESSSPLVWLAMLAAGYLATTITIFFNVALASCATRSMDGQDTKVGEGIAVASRRLPQVLAWAAVAFVVGLILRLLDELADEAPFPLSLVANIGVALLGMAWSVLTFLVIPVVALEGLGPREALTRSKTLVLAKWGEGLAGNVGISLVVTLLTAVPGVVLVMLGLGAGILAVTALGVLVIVGGAILGSTLQQVFAVALYRYALTGQAPTGFDGADVEDAFVRRAIAA